MDREIAGFLATIPPSQARRLTFAINLMRQRMMIPGGGVAAGRPTVPGRLEMRGTDDPPRGGQKAA